MKDIKITDGIKLLRKYKFVVVETHEIEVFEDVLNEWIGNGWVYVETVYRKEAGYNFPIALFKNFM